MKKAICLVLSICLCFSLSCCAASKTDSFSDDSKAMQEASNSVIMLSCYDKNGELYATGSAFAAFEAGVFITNFHVIEGEVYSIKAQMETGLEFSISSVVAYDEERDIAILRTESNTGLAPLPLGKSSDMEKGEKVIAIGSPLGLINTLSTGLYSGTLTDGQVFLQFSAGISHGSSGGALFNDKGEVVGITSASYTEGQNLNLAIPIDDAVELWEQRYNSAELSIPDFYDLWDHIPSYSISYILSHRREFNSGMIINTGGYVFYNPSSFDPSSQTKRNYWLVEAPEDYYAICNALEELNAYGGELSGEDRRKVEFSLRISSDDFNVESDLERFLKEYVGDADEQLVKHYVAQINYEDVLEKTALSVSGYKQNGTVALGEYAFIQGEIFQESNGLRLRKVSVIENSGN